MMYYLGIDGGGTKTKFSICDEKGIIKASVEETTCHYLQVGFDGVTKIINKGLDDICSSINIKRDNITYAFAGIPGYGDVRKDMKFIEEAVKDAMKQIPFSIGNDGENALAGSLCCKDGINIVAGTGSIGFGYNSQTNTTLKCGGWHHGIGSDEGSAYWIAYNLLHEYTRQIDGRDEKTELYHKVKDFLKLEDDGDVIKVVISEWKLDRTKVASLSVLADELYSNNDKYAIEIVNEAAKQLAELVISLHNNLKFNKKITVSYSGGVFKMGDKIIEPLKKQLSSIDCSLEKPVLSPDKGSLLLALKNNNIKITDEIIHNMKNN